MNPEQLMQALNEIGQIVMENNAILKQLAGGGQQEPQGASDDEALRQQAIANLMGQG